MTSATTELNGGSQAPLHEALRRPDCFVDVAPPGEMRGECGGERAAGTVRAGSDSSAPEAPNPGAVHEKVDGIGHQMPAGHDDASRAEP